MRVLLRLFGAANQVRIFKKEVECPQMRVLLRPFGSAIQVWVFKKEVRVSANPRPVAAVWHRNSGASLWKGGRVSSNARPFTAISSRESGANLIYLNVIKKGSRVSANVHPAAAIWSCKSGANLFYLNVEPKRKYGMSLNPLSADLLREYRFTYQLWIFYI